MLAPAQVAQFQAEGYVIVPAFFSAAEATEMRAELERMEAQGLGRDVMPGDQWQNIHFVHLDQHSDLFRDLPARPAVLAAVQQLIGTPVLLWLDQIFLKPARTGAGNSWHEDNARFKVPDVTRGTGMWIALHDAHRGNGSLELIPGSFRHSDPTLPFRLPTPAEEAQAVVAEMPAGGVVFFNFGMLHCTRHNPTDTPRAAAAFHFLQAGNLPPPLYQDSGRNIWLGEMGSTMRAEAAAKAGISDLSTS